MKTSKLVTITAQEAVFLLNLVNGKSHEQTAADMALSKSAFYGHQQNLINKLKGGWNEAKPVRKTMVETVLEEINAIIDESKNSLIRRDVLSSQALMTAILERGDCRPGEVQVANGLRMAGYEFAGRIMLWTKRHNLWALPGIGKDHAAARVRERLIQPQKY